LVCAENFQLWLKNGVPFASFGPYHYATGRLLVQNRNLQSLQVNCNPLLVSFDPVDDSAGCGHVAVP
jgi:hypothetical protein